MRKLKLKTKYVGKEIHYFDELKSTNEKANKLADNVEEGTVVIAEKQKKGIGRFGREWTSPKGGVYVSVILKPKISPIDAPKITLITGIAVAKVIRKLGLDAKLKWPNEGINVNIDISTFPKELQKGATSLKEEFEKEVSMEKIIEDMLYEIEINYETFKKGNIAYLLNEWKRLSNTIGKKVKIKMRTEVIEGEAVALTREGQLVMKLENDSLKNIIAGECIHLRNEE
jgi:BirA family biotin operon repressor/biotin-[acetyl-CoA-carboxylase] ligase